jgi:hypothetical protein
MTFYMYRVRWSYSLGDLEILCKPCQNTTPNLDLSAKLNLATFDTRPSAGLCGVNLSEVIVFLYGLQIRCYIYAFRLTRREKHNGGVYSVF